MTGPEHYREAEQLLAVAFASEDTTFEGHNPEADRLIAAALVHATLAQAAATAEANPEIAAYLPHDEHSVLPWLDLLISKTPKES